jgi:dihydrofolate reductase
VAELVYSSIQSLDGYIADENGGFGWARPGEEVHAFVNDLTRPIGTYLFGRRMYEVMAVWERPEEFEGMTDAVRDFAALWRTTDKVVYSRTLDAVSTERTRLEHEFDPEAVRALKESSERDLAIGGPTLAASAFRAGLVDELQIFVVPAIVGGGTRSLPDGVRIDLELVEERRFANGMAYLRYRTAR